MSSVGLWSAVPPKTWGVWISRTKFFRGLKFCTNIGLNKPYKYAKYDQYLKKNIYYVTFWVTCSGVSHVRYLFLCIFHFIASGRSFAFYSLVATVRWRCAFSNTILDVLRQKPRWTRAQKFGFFIHNFSLNQGGHWKRLLLSVVGMSGIYSGVEKTGWTITSIATLSNLNKEYPTSGMIMKSDPMNTYALLNCTNI